MALFRNSDEEDPFAVFDMRAPGSAQPQMSQVRKGKLILIAMSIDVSIYACCYFDGSMVDDLKTLFCVQIIQASPDSGYSTTVVHSALAECARCLQCCVTFFCFNQQVSLNDSLKADTGFSTLL